MTPLGEYLYCIIRCSEDRLFSDVSAIGNSMARVHTVTHDGLAVVVSDSPLSEYEATRANMIAHQGVQERVMREFTLLPVRFGTVGEPDSSTRDIRRLLERRSQEFHRLLTEMEGKVELGLKAYWRDEKLLFEEIVGQSETIRRLRSSLHGKSPHATHFDRIRLGELVKEKLDLKRAAEAASLLSPLRGIAWRTIENATVVDRMIVNAAFLVENEREEEFDRAVNELDKEFQYRILVKYVGPVPPYNFVNVTVNWQEL